MSHTNYISTLLDLKDKNITFSENWIEELRITGVHSKVIFETLAFQPTHFYHYTHVFNSNIIKHGFKTSRIKLIKISDFDAYLILKNNGIDVITVIIHLRLKLLSSNQTVIFLIPLNKLFFRS